MTWHGPAGVFSCKADPPWRQESLALGACLIKICCLGTWIDKWTTVCYPCPQVVPSTAPLVEVHPLEKKDLGAAGWCSQLNSDVSSLACLGTAVKPTQ